MDPKRVVKIFEKLECLVLTLHPDPVSLGPKHLQNQIATCRNYINEVSLISSEIQQERTRTRKTLKALKDLYDLDAAELLTKDERVIKLPSIKDREGIIKVLLSDKIREINNVSSQLEELQDVEKAINHRMDQLKDTMSDIKAQKALVQIEIDTGAMYGDESTPAALSNTVGRVDSFTTEELSSLLEEAAENTPIKTPVATETTIPKTPVINTGENTQIDNVEKDPITDLLGPVEEDPSVSKFLLNDDTLPEDLSAYLNGLT